MNRRRSRAASNTAAVVGASMVVDRLALDLGPVPLFEERGRVADDQLPALRLAKCGIEHPVHVVDGARRQAALPVAPAAFNALA